MGQWSSANSSMRSTGAPSIAACAAITRRESSSPRSHAASYSGQEGSPNSISRCSATSWAHAVPSKSTRTEAMGSTPARVSDRRYAAAVSREIEERIATGLVAFWRDRVRHLPGHVIHEVDGVVVCLTGLDDDEQNAALIEREPEDAPAALEETERVFREHGRTLGVDVERGRHPNVDAALRAMDLEMVV